MVSTRPLSRMTTPLPPRSVPRMDAVKASDGTIVCKVTMDSSAWLRSNWNSSGSGCLTIGSSERGFSVMVPFQPATRRRQRIGYGTRSNLGHGSAHAKGLDAVQGLLNVLQDVLDILQADGEPEQP